MLYFDASALAKRYVREKGSLKVRRLLASDLPATSRYSVVEITSALTRRTREGAIYAEDCERAVAALGAGADVGGGAVGIEENARGDAGHDGHADEDSRSGRGFGQHFDPPPFVAAVAAHDRLLPRVNPASRIAGRLGPAKRKPGRAVISMRRLARSPARPGPHRVAPGASANTWAVNP